MRKRTNINRTLGLLRMAGILIGWLSGLFLTACTDEIKDISPLPGADETLVQLNITAPGSSLPKTRAMPLSDNFEYDIRNIRVLVFDKETNTFLYMVKGQQIRPDETNTQKTQFNVLLKTSLKPIRLVLVANAEASFDSYTPASGDSEEEVRKKIRDPFGGNLIGQIPMYGEKELSSLDATGVNSISVTMLRAVARVDVELDPDMNQSGDFQLKEVYIYRANDRMQVIPDREAMSGTNTLNVLAPSVPSDAARVDSYDKKFDFPQQVIEQLYVPESTGRKAGADDGNVTCVVVGGNYNGEDNISYYRADFKSGNDELLGQVLRNHRYLFKIKQVTGSGWENPDEAARNRSTLIVVEIKSWEDFTMEMYANGDNYLGIAARDVIFGYKAGLKKQVGIQSTVPYTITWKETGENTNVAGVMIQDTYFTATIVNAPEEGSDVSYIRFTTRSENNTKANRVSKMVVQWNNWVFEISVTQLYEEVNARRSVRILSTTNAKTGHLGNTTTAPSGDGMRPILINPDYFSARGIVNYFSGFDFTIPGADPFAKANGTNDETHRMLTMLYSSDVVYMVNDNQVSEYSTRKIKEWLEENPRRVLIVGGDASNTSPYVLRADLDGWLSDQVDWYYNAAHGGSYHYSPLKNPVWSSTTFLGVDYNEGVNDVFMRGPFTEQFGPVANGFKVNIADGYFGYASSWSDDIIPLITINGHTSLMALGVDPKRRIIYFGDASTWQSGRMTGAGTIKSEHEKLWANIWAWITYQVIWGDDQLIDKF